MNAQDSCVSYQDSYLACVIGDVGSGSCGGLACQQERQDFLDCKGIFSTSGTCAVDPNGGCDCSVGDNMGNSYRSICSGSGQTVCECQFNGMSVGKCAYPAPAICDPFYDCCATVFFVPFLPGMMWQ